MFWFIAHMYYETPPISLTTFSCIWATQYFSENLRIHLTVSVQFYITNKHMCLCDIDSQAITLPLSCFIDDMVCFGSEDVLSLFLTFFLAATLVEIDLGFICPKNVPSELGWLFWMLLAKSNFAFLFLRLTTGLHQVVIPLYLLSYSLQFIVDLELGTPTSWRALFLWLAVVHKLSGNGSPTTHPSCPPLTHKFFSIAELSNAFLLSTSGCTKL